MAPKVPKKPLKSMEKLIEKPIRKIRTKKRNYHGFSIYIYQVLRHIINEQYGISRKSMGIMNNIVNDLFEKIAVEAGRLVAHGKRTTLSSREIQTAVKLLVPGELEAHSKNRAIKALTLYYGNKKAEAGTS